MSSHAELVEIAYRWVLRAGRCGVAFRELVSHTAEQPDVIGFGHAGRSVVVECKATRADFMADARKFFRRTPELGMGRYRFYLCPDGLLEPEEMPAKWGLIYTDGTRTRIVHNPYNANGGNVWSGGFVPNADAERAHLYSALRRLHLRGRIEEIYDSPFNRVSSLEGSEAGPRSDRAEGEPGRVRPDQREGDAPTL